MMTKYRIRVVLEKCEIGNDGEEYTSTSAFEEIFGLYDTRKEADRWLNVILKGW